MAAAHGAAERARPAASRALRPPAYLRRARSAARGAPQGSEAALGGLGAAWRCPTVTLGWAWTLDTLAGALYGS